MASIINAGTTSNTALNMSADTSGTLDLQSNGTTMASVTSTGFNIGGAVASGFTMKNRIINGDMVIDQRNAGASVTPTAIATWNYTIDRWAALISAASKFSVQQNAGSVTPPAGFTNYLGVTSLSAYSVTSGDYFWLEQPIEGFNTADLNFGTANAKTITLSFWVRSSLTGTFGGSLANVNNDYAYPFSYTISSANTWTQISITIAGPTAGTWNTTNSQGIRVRFGLGVGSSNSGTAGAWANVNYVSATGAVSVVGTNGATFYITGVQLERGSQATSFEWLPYGTELALCQRYYQRWAQANGGDHLGNGQANGGNGTRRVNWATNNTMRATPSLNYSGTITAYISSGSGTNLSSLGYAAGSTPSRISVDMNTAGSCGTAGDFIFVLLGSSAWFEASSEL